MGQKKVCFNRRENETGEKGARGTREYIDTAEMSLLGPIYLGPQGSSHPRVEMSDIIRKFLGLHDLPP